MEQKLNIAEILKEKASGTKLWSHLFGDVYFDSASAIVTVSHYKALAKFWSNAKLYDYDEAEPTLFPSKEMRDWHKFAWKRGDVLVGVGQRIIFEKFIDENYTEFQGKYSLSTYEDRTLVVDKRCYTSYFRKLDDSVNVKNYFKEIEERLGGKLNRDTLEIEKTQPKFKDGDIVAVDLDRKNIRIFKEKKNGNNICWGKYYIGFSFNNEGKLIQTFKNYTADCSSDRLATDSEKQQLFSALEKEGKAWDSNKKSIVDLKPKVEFKPMDLCLMKYIGQYNNRGWELCQYAYTEHRVSSSGEQRDFYHAVGGEIYAECIPYNEDTKHLLGTRDKWKGGEG